MVANTKNQASSMSLCLLHIKLFSLNQWEDMTCIIHMEVCMWFAHADNVDLKAEASCLCQLECAKHAWNKVYTYMYRSNPNYNVFALCMSSPFCLPVCPHLPAWNVHVDVPIICFPDHCM